MSRPHQGVLGKPGKLFERSEFLAGFPKMPWGGRNDDKGQYMAGAGVSLF
jgi:hypothetical protein